MATQPRQHEREESSRDAPAQRVVKIGLKQSSAVSRGAPEQPQEDGEPDDAQLGEDLQEIIVRVLVDGRREALEELR